MTRVLTALLILLGAITAARADSNCDHPRNGFDGVYCQGQIYNQADADLNNNYVRLWNRLNDEERSVLRKGQLAWIRLRDRQCSRQEDTGFFVNLACATKLTIARNEFLEDRYRECASTGCLDSRLSQ